MSLIQSIILGSITFVSLVIIIAIGVWYRLSCKDDNDFTPLKWSMIYPRLKTGDIIGISYDGIYGKLVKIFTGSIWTHIGMIVKTDKRIAVLEIAHYETNRQGVLLTPLDKFMNWNGERLCIYRPYEGEMFPSRSLYKIISQTGQFRTNFNVVEWLKTMITLPHQEPYKDRYYCSEYLGFVLQKIGVLVSDRDPSGYQPWQFIYENMNWISPHKYGTPFIIVK